MILPGRTAEISYDTPHGLRGGPTAIVNGIVTLTQLGRETLLIGGQ
jgi:hypothetical protein